MTQTFTVEEVSQNVEDVQLDHGLFKSYRMHLMPQGATTPVMNVQWLRKAGSPAPQSGQQLTGTLEESRFGPKFKQERQFPIGSGGPRPEDPARAKRIVRQHSQEMALRYAEIRAAQGKLPEDFTPSMLTSIIDWFEKDAEGSAS